MSVNLNNINGNNINGFGGNIYAERISSNRARTASIQSQLDDRNQKIANIDKQIAKHEKDLVASNRRISLYKDLIQSNNELIGLYKESKALDVKKMEILKTAIDKLQALLDKADGKVVQKTGTGAKLDVVIDDKFQRKVSSTERKQLDISEVPVNGFKKKVTPEATVVETKNNIAPVIPSKTSVENKVPSSPKHEISKEAYSQYQLDSERLELLSTKLLTSNTGYFGKQPELSDYIGTTNYPDFIYSKVVSGYLNKLS